MLIPIKGCVRSALCKFFGHKKVEVDRQFEGEIVKVSYICTRCSKRLDDSYEYQ